MSLSELIAGVEAHQKTLTVFNADPGVTASLREHFDDRNVVVREATVEEGPTNYVVLSKGEDFLTAADIGDLIHQETTEPPFDEAASYQPILDHLDETMFTSYDTSQMVAASREIEDRAWRIGSGALYAGFQTLSVLAGQIAVYDRLAARGDLSVHAYAFPDTDPPDHDEVTIHIERADEIRDSWFVVYDGDGVDENKCALLAEEREPRSFYGFWTYDPDTVDWIVDHLSSAYGLVESP